MEELPGDLASNILIRLPAKLLAQMRCVSKPWNALLSQPSFIKSHLDRSVYNNDEIVLVFDNDFFFDIEPFTAHSSQSPEIELPNFIKFPVEFLSDEYKGGKIIGSINGLVCLSYNYTRNVIHIWNPSLSALLTLPPTTMPSLGNVLISNFFRFGFDPETDDYKVVKITGRRNTCYVIEEWMQVEVYSMRKHSWELITERVPSHVTMFLERDEVCVDGHDGHLHWLGCIDEDIKLQTIVAFDLGVEAFSLISLPDILVDYNVDRWIVLSVFAGKLCLMCNIDFVCEVWVMDKYGVAGSWVKHHVFSQVIDIIPFGFTLRKEFLFETYECRLALYDPVAAKVKLFKSMPLYRDRTKVVLYVDSLVWVAPTQNISAV